VVHGRRPGGGFEPEAVAREVSGLAAHLRVTVAGC
jgi:hypothetical protein